MSPFLTVKEAALRIGKSKSSIRRVIYPIIHNDKHPDRQQVQPSPEEVLKLRMKGETVAWRLSEELLQRAIPAEAHSENVKEGSHSSLHGGDAGTELLTMLRRELEIKNQQIMQQSEMLSRQMELISGLSERLREGNVLTGLLQQQLALPDVSVRKKSSVVDAESGNASAAPSPAKSVTKPPKAPKPTRGFFSGLFR